jgi:hypothetical protein
MTKGLQEAEELARLYMSPRAKRLDKLERYVEGTQYDGRPSFLEPEEDVPLMQRAPCVVYGAAAVAMGQHIDFALGEGRFPKISTGVAEDDADADDVFGLSTKDSEVFDAFVANLINATKFISVAEEAMEDGEGIGTAVGIIVCRNGDLTMESLDAKWCTPTFDDTGEVTSVEICYPYVEIIRDEDGEECARCLLYKRVVDKVHDVSFKPSTAIEGGKMPSFVELARTAHGFDFCPVQWWARKKGAKRAGVIDGHAIHETQLDEIDALNFSLSQRYRATLSAGDPQICETGVSKDEQVAPVTGRAIVVKDEKSGRGFFGMSSRPRNSRRKGAGTVWRYESKDAKAFMLCIPPEVLEGMTAQARDIEEKLASLLGYTKLEVQGVRGAMSGKALAFLFARTTAFVDRERRDLWDGFMCPAISKLIRAARALTKANKSVFVPGLKKVMPILDRFERKLDGGHTHWRIPELTPTWGAYFDLNAEDENYLVMLTAKAYESKLVPRVICVEKLRPVFGYRNAEAIVEQLEKEDEERAAKQQDMLAAQAAAQPPNEGAPVKPGQPAPKQAQPPPKESAK